MAVLSATRRFADMGAFLAERDTMRAGAVLVPAESLGGRPAPVIKLDLVVPGVGRVGPIEAQLIQELPGGSAAFRVPEWPSEAVRAFDVVEGIVASVRAWLIQVGQVQEPDEQIQRELAELKARVNTLQARAHVAMAPVGAAAPAEGGAAPGRDPARPRGLVIPDVSQLQAALEGKLGDRSLRDALMELALARANGLLTVDLPGGQVRWGLWSKGGPVGFRAEPLVEEEVLGALLFRGNQITKEQLQASLAMMEETGVRQGEALVEQGVMGFAQLVLVLQKQAEFVFRKVLASTEGKWWFHILPSLPETFINPPIRVPSILFRQLRQEVREMPAEELASALKPWLDRYMYLPADSQRTYDEIKFTNEEQGFLKILQSTSYRVREVFAVSNLSRSSTAGMVYALADLNLLEFREDESAERVAERVKRDVEGRMYALEKGTYFDLLEVHWICTVEEVEAAYKRLCDMYSDEKTRRWSAEHQAKLKRIQEAMEKAYATLRSDVRRREYRAQVMEPLQISQSAEMLARKGDMAVMKHSKKEAVDCYVRACELEPNSRTHAAGLSRAREMGG